MPIHPSVISSLSLSLFLSFYLSVQICLTSLLFYAQLEPYTKEVLQHFVFRYWSYYRDPEHVAHYVQPWLQEVIDRVSQHFSPLASNSSSKGKVFVSLYCYAFLSVFSLSLSLSLSLLLDQVLLFSAHDITLFAVLSVFGAKHVTQGPLALSLDNLDRVYDIWPHYGKNNYMIEFGFSSFPTYLTVSLSLIPFKGSVLSIEVTKANLSGISSQEETDRNIQFRIHYNTKPLSVDLGFYPEYLSHSSNNLHSSLSWIDEKRQRSLQDELLINEEVHACRKERSNAENSCMFSLYELKQLNTMLKPFVHYNDEYSE
jgi:hypothetical protein